ncbi:hypothetical protein PIB30_045223, partial [Stylosanthes scabra]|nr:hypothetical protein [Stylosanthes scabra]
QQQKSHQLHTVQTRKLKTIQIPPRSKSIYRTTINLNLRRIKNKTRKNGVLPLSGDDGVQMKSFRRKTEEGTTQELHGGDDVVEHGGGGTTLMNAAMGDPQMNSTETNNTGRRDEPEKGEGSGTAMEEFQI